MDVIDKYILDGIKVAEIPTVTEKLDATPRLIPNYLGERKSVEFGNTGLVVHFGSGENVFDFVPEGSSYPEDSNAAKYASILCVSLFELHKFLNDTAVKPELDVSGVTEILNPTNTRLVNAIKELLSRSDTQNLVEVDEGKHVVKINLQNFKTINEEDPLMKYLSRVSERARNTMVTYDKDAELPQQ